MGIVVDLETTGLLKASPCDVFFQPQIIEVYMGKFCDETFEITKSLKSLIKPVDRNGSQIPLEEHIVKITGIEDYMLSDKPTFYQVVKKIARICEDERILVGQNVMFDHEVLRYNFIRVGEESLFPKFPIKRCTVEMSRPLEHKRIRLGDLYTKLTGKVIENAHRAEDDSLATLEIYQTLLEWDLQ